MKYLGVNFFNWMLLFSTFFLYVACDGDTVDVVDTYCDPEPLSEIFTCATYTDRSFAPDQVQDLTELVNSPSFTSCTRITLEAGTYVFSSSLKITQDGIILEGAAMDETILEFNDASATAGVDMQGEHLVVKDLTVQNADKHNIFMSNSKRILIQNVRATWDIQGGRYGSRTDNGDYAIYPVLSKYIVLDNVIAENSKDAGIYVGQSGYVVIRNSIARYNVAGLEVENTCFFDVYGNTVENNTGGLLIFDLPGNLVVGQRGRIFNNTIVDNNLRTFCSSGTVCEIPSGTGMVLLATRNLEIYGNTFRNHGTADIAMINGYTLDVNDYLNEGGDPHVYNLYIHDNIFMGTSGHDLNGLRFNFYEDGPGYIRDFGADSDLDIDAVRAANSEIISTTGRELMFEWYREGYSSGRGDTPAMIVGYTDDEILDPTMNTTGAQMTLIDEAYKADLEFKALAAVVYAIADIQDNSTIEYSSLGKESFQPAELQYAMILDGIDRSNPFTEGDFRNTNTICIGASSGERVPALLDMDILANEDALTDLFNELDNQYNDGVAFDQLAVDGIASVFNTKVGGSVRTVTGGVNGSDYGDYTCDQEGIDRVLNEISAQGALFANELFSELEDFE